MRRPHLLLALLLPAACAQQPETTDTAQLLQEVLAAHQANLMGIGGRPVAAPVEGTEPEPRSAARAAALDLAAGGTPTMAGQLVGQTPGAVLRWLGEPRLRREEGAAEVWHYQAPQCHLDLVLYREEGAGADWRVAFASARAVGTARRGEAACLRDIARGAARPSPPGLTEQADAGA
jgi:hypothetical protein